jgi:predicted permease
MTSIALIILNFLMIVGASWLISYIIRRWSFSPKRHAKLSARYDGMSIAGLNSGAIILCRSGSLLYLATYLPCTLALKTPLFKRQTQSAH